VSFNLHTPPKKNANLLNKLSIKQEKYYKQQYVKIKNTVISLSCDLKRFNELLQKEIIKKYHNKSNKKKVNIL